MDAADLTVPRPWTARPMVRDSAGMPWPGCAWEVVGKSRHGGATLYVATHLSEHDARVIAAAGNAAPMPNAEASAP